MPSAETGPESELMKPTLRSAAVACKAARATAPRASVRMKVRIFNCSERAMRSRSTQPMQGTFQEYRGTGFAGPLVLPPVGGGRLHEVSQPGGELRNQLPLALFELHDHARALV